MKKRAEKGNGWPVMQRLLITDRHGQDHTGKSIYGVSCLSCSFSSAQFFLTIWRVFLFYASFYHISANSYSIYTVYIIFYFPLSISLSFYTSRSLTSTHTHTASQAKRRRKTRERERTSIMACQLSKALVCCAR